MTIWVVRVLLAPFIAVARALPAGAAARLGEALGWLWYRMLPVRRSVVRTNLRRALALSPTEAEPIVRAMYLHLGRSFVELLRFGARPLPAGLVHAEGRAHLEGALAAGRGVLVLTAHLGNWELLVRAGTLADRPVSVITRRLRAGWAEAAWRALRRDGPRLLPAGACARDVLAALARNEIVGFVLDQHCAAARAVRVPFFDRPAATDPDLVRLAALSGAPIVPVFTWREAEHHVVRVEPPVELPEAENARALRTAGTARCVARVEAAIRAHPEQWLWLHRRWKVGPEPG